MLVRMKRWLSLNAGWISWCDVDDGQDILQSNGLKMLQKEGLNQMGAMMHSEPCCLPNKVRVNERSRIRQVGL